MKKTLSIILSAAILVIAIIPMSIGFAFELIEDAFITGGKIYQSLNNWIEKN